MAGSVKVFIGRAGAWQGKDSGMIPAMGQGSSCMGGAWRALAEPPWMLALDPDPTVCKWEMSSFSTSTAAKHGDHQPHFGVWIVLEALERHRARNTLVQQSIHPCCATGTAHPYCRLRQQMAMATAELLPGTAAATQELSTA